MINSTSPEDAIKNENWPCKCQAHQTSGTVTLSWLQMEYLMSLTTEQIEKIVPLIQDNNVESVEQGLTLLDGLLETEEELVDFLSTQMKEAPDIKDTITLN